ncbi:MAG TPA: molybdopterin cofactor-binding domain-containing protein [Ktedonobacteraceae bacterium]
MIRLRETGMPLAQMIHFAELRSQGDGTATERRLILEEHQRALEQHMHKLEQHMDELAYALDLDPLELRLRNDTPVHPQSGQPWSSRNLRECFEVGAQAFGWERRPRAPRSMRDGHELIGWGVAGSYYPYNRQPAEARLRLLANGSALIQSSATDIGPGTATILAQIASDALGLPLAKIRCELC